MTGPLLTDLAWIPVLVIGAAMDVYFAARFVARALHRRRP